MKKIKWLFSHLLFTISLIVAVGLYEHENMWTAIVAYWITLSIKNGVDCFFQE